MILRSGRNLKEKSEAKPIDPSNGGAVSMEPPAFATPTPHSKNSKKRLNSASSMDAEVIEVSTPTTLSKSTKMKEAQLSTHLAANSVKVSKSKKGKKTITDKSPAVTKNSRSSLNSPSGIVLPKTQQPQEPLKTSLIDQQDGHIADIIKKYELFKRFDTVQDYSDHHYSRSSSSKKQPPKAWAKRIQEDWKILEKDLPDKIFVRAYEERMDLMRAVILGAEGTPYHDGLFFFDIFFPSNYPNCPPEVHYHSHGLRLNPNLYDCGKVCVSLLNTWGGNPDEQWQKNLSTMLQVLVSIQGLILNAKPFFNEPGYENSSGTKAGEGRSLKYNESTFILSLKTMSYTMRKPPKCFEELVVGHFMKRAQDILEVCKSYLDGAPIGSVVKGKVQDLDASHKNSKKFKENLFSYLPLLGKDLTNLGLKGVDSFLPPPAASPPVTRTQRKS